MRERLKACFPSGRGVFHRRFADFVAELDGRDGFAADQLRLAAALVSYQLELGQVSLSLPELAGRRVFAGLGDPESPVEIRAPALDAWLGTLSSSPVVCRAGDDDARPLVLDDSGRLYLHRYWDYQRRLFAVLQAHACDTDADPAAVRSELDRLFAAPGEAIDWQRLAAALALHRRLCVITGGAGTGKTTTVVKILAALRRLEGEHLRIALAAPTGKAAARLAESIRGAKARMALPADELAAIPEQAGTLHRLLGVRRHSTGFRHDAEHPLPVDCLVVDEASMVDLALMCKLCEALPADARLILLGDPYQLAAVEAGSVLADLAAGGANRFSRGGAAWLAAATAMALATTALDAKGSDAQPDLFTPAAADPDIADTVVELQVTHRFAGNIGRLAQAIKQGEADTALAILADPEADDAGWHRTDGHWLDAAMQTEIEAWFEGYRRPEPDEALRRLDQFRILCAHREGALGVATVNELVERRLRQAGLIRGGEWYPGRPVMITRNDHAMELYNGDVGVCLPDAGGVPRVWFPGSGAARAFAPGRLPEHETVFAMTVHKTQGSEFARILLLLPERESPIVNRALLYTAVTRAKQAVRVFGSERMLLAAL